MIPVKLQISGFLSYQETVDVDFSGFNLACISGTNGAGKSSLLDAITWVLFGNARRTDDSIINSHSDKASVTLIFQYENQIYRVERVKHRNKTGTLEFTIQTQDSEWSILTGSTMRETEEKIKDTLRMDYETFINASFFLQGKADQFAQQRPADRKRILGSILGLEQWDTYQTIAINRRKLLENDVKIIDGQLSEIQAELDQEEERKQNLARVEKELEQISGQRKAKEESFKSLERLDAALNSQRQTIARMEIDLNSTRTRRDRAAAELESRQVEINEIEILLKSEQTINIEFKEWETTRQEKEALDLLAAKFRQLDERRQPLLQQIAGAKGRIEQEMANLQTILTRAPQTEKDLFELETKLPDLLSQLDAWQAIVSNRPVWESGRLTAGDEISRLEAENKTLREAMDELAERRDTLKTAAGADCPLCGQELSDRHRDDLLASLEHEGLSLKTKFLSNKDQIADQQKEKAGFDAHIQECDRVDRQLSDARRNYDRDVDRLAVLKQQKQDQDAARDRLEIIQPLIASGKYVPDINEELDKLEEEIRSIGFDQTKLDALSEKENRLRQVNEKKQAIEKAKARLEPLQREILSIQKQLSDNKDEITQREDELNKARQELEEQSAGLPDLPVLRQELAALQTAETGLIGNAGQARQMVHVLDTQRKRKTELSQKRTDLTSQIANYKVLENAFGKNGVQALLIEEALPEIETRANEILDRLSGGSMSVRFETQKEYKDKNREDKRETLDILIGDGAGVRAYELFSGGEAFRVNFAIRLALSRELAHRAGARLQTLVIDEGFGSQDIDGRQRLIETINLVQPDFAKILVITHLEELKEAFPARIEVEKTLRGSKVTVA